MLSDVVLTFFFSAILLSVIYIEVCRRLNLTIVGSRVGEDFLIWPQTGNPEVCYFDFIDINICLCSSIPYFFTSFIFYSFRSLQIKVFMSNNLIEFELFGYSYRSYSRLSLVIACLVLLMVSVSMTLEQRLLTSIAILCRGLS